MSRVSIELPDDVLESVRSAARHAGREVEDELRRCIEAEVSRRRAAAKTLAEIDALHARLKLTEHPPVQDDFLREAKNEGRR